MTSLLAFYALAGLCMVLSALSQTALWQRKEYRIDRVRAYLFSPEKSTRDILVWIIAGVFALFSLVFSWLAYVSIFILLIGYGIRAIHRGIVRPKFTVRAIAVIVISFLVGLFVFLSTASIAIIALKVICMPLVVALAVWIVAIPSMLKKKAVIAKATAYRTALKNLQVIGITGSVGKTSTKTYALHLVKNTSDEEIIATQEHRNSPYVVAQDMVSRVSEKTGTYIAELGAYRKGEIAELCHIVQPNIGVITAITNQHAGLFGSVAELAQTKWELADAVSKTGILVLNKDDETIRNKAKDLHKNIIWYSLKTSADIYFENILLKQDHTECVLVVAGERHDVRIPVISYGQLGSVLAACAVAHAMNVPVKNIAEQLAALPVLKKTMEYKILSNKAIIVDDSYSASEASVMNAIEYLKSVGDETSLLVLVPIIELGNESSIVHEKIGTTLAHVPFKTFIYGTAYQEDIMRGLAQASHAHITWYTDAKVLASDVAKHSAPNTITVFEGRLPGIVTAL